MASIQIRNSAGMVLYSGRFRSLALCVCSALKNNVSLRSARLINADLDGIDFSGKDLHGVNFQRSRLQGANFMTANLECAQLQDVDATRASFRAARMSHVIAEHANFREATLTAAQCVDGVFRDAQMYHCDVRQADFAGADMYGAKWALAHHSSTFTATQSLHYRDALYAAFAVLPRLAPGLQLELSAAVLREGHVLRFPAAESVDSLMLAMLGADYVAQWHALQYSSPARVALLRQWLTQFTSSSHVLLDDDARHAAAQATIAWAGQWLMNVRMTLTLNDITPTRVASQSVHTRKLHGVTERTSDA